VRPATRLVSFCRNFDQLLTSRLVPSQCDEGHPTCRNCKKSKRECLGYDPIFKPQPTPSAIQPAPNSSSTHPTTNQPYPPPPQGYMPASQTFSQHLAASVDSPSSSLGQYDYGAPIDPALEGTTPSQMAAPTAFDSGQGFQSVVKNETNSISSSEAQGQKGASLLHVHSSIAHVTTVTDQNI
jgi:hypothetical protein